MNAGTAHFIALAIAFFLVMAFTFNNTGKNDCERKRSPATCFEAMNR